MPGETGCDATGPAAGHKGRRSRGTNLKICPGRAGRMECGVLDPPTLRSTPRWAAAISPSSPPSPTVTRVLLTARRLVGARERARRGRRLAGRSDSPTPVNWVGSGGGPHLEYGGVRRFPMRSQAAGGAQGATRYIPPTDKLQGREPVIFEERDRKLEGARRRRQMASQQGPPPAEVAR